MMETRAIFFYGFEFLGSKRTTTGEPNKRTGRMARIEAEMSQADLADEVGVTRQTIGLIESGKFNPSLRLCIDICRVLKKTLNDIFWEEHDEKE